MIHDRIGACEPINEDLGAQADANPYLIVEL
jgi:hypothetical protein